MVKYDPKRRVLPIGGARIVDCEHTMHELLILGLLTCASQSAVIHIGGWLYDVVRGAEKSLATEPGLMVFWFVYCQVCTSNSGEHTTKCASARYR